MTFSEATIEGFEAHGSSNPVERQMGEVNKRRKNQRTRWTSEGLETLLQLRLVKYADPAHYQLFLDTCSSDRPKQQ